MSNLSGPTQRRGKVPINSELFAGHSALPATCYSRDDQAITMSTKESTIESVRAGIISGDPEFLDAVGVEKHFGIRRSLLFRLLAEKQIRGVSIRQRGRLRGKRLFDCESIRKFLLANVDREPVEAAETQD